jgi:Zn-dependent alcohol dehydrogenase
VIVGIGGVKSSAAQGAAHAGAGVIVAVEPIEHKRSEAVRFGATHVAADTDEAEEIVRKLTGGRMADSVNLTVGNITSPLVAASIRLVAKGGRIVLTGGAPPGEIDGTMNLANVHSLQQEITGTMLGHAQPRIDIPRLLRLYQKGDLKLDELISRRHSLDEVNEGYRDLEAGRNLRGIIAFG